VGSFATAVAFSPDGTSAYVGTSGGVAVVDVSAHSVVATIPVTGDPWDLEITPDEPRCR
jgi:YVTN family beta-propeller protein